MTTTNLSNAFYGALDQALAGRATSLNEICPDGDAVARRVLHDYGAMFVGTSEILPPPLCVFTSEEQVSEFQNAAGVAAATIGDAVIELQPAAMSALLQARDAARAEGLDITPRDGAEAARRSYAD